VCAQCLFVLIARAAGQGLDLDGEACGVLLAGDDFVELLGVSDLRADRLAVGHLGVADFRLNLEFADDPCHEDVEVQLSHAADDDLASLFVLVDGEGRVLARQNFERFLQLVAVRKGLWLDRHRDHRLGEVHLFEQDRVSLRAERIAGLGEFEPHEHGDVPRTHRVDGFALVRVHAQKSRDALTLFLRCVVDRRRGVERPRIHADITESPCFAVVLDLEYKPKRIAVCLTGNFHVLFFFCMKGHDCPYLVGCGQIVHDCVEERLDPHIPARGPCKDRHEMPRNTGFPDFSPERLFGNRRAFEIETGDDVGLG
jgi:hypothetical protein